MGNNGVVEVDKSQSFPNSRTNAVTNLRQLVLRQILPVGLSIVVFIVLWDKAAALDFAGIWAGIGQVSLLEWGIAAMLSLASFWAVGRYDAVVHRLANTGIDDAQATRAGVAAIAVAQSVGFGVISGALVRWRMLPNLSLLQSIKVSVTVAASFLAGWAVVASVAILICPTIPAIPAASLIAWGVLLFAASLALLSLLKPGPLTRLKVPSLKAMGTILLLALVDTLMAGGAAYALLPASIHIDLLTFLTAFLLALGAGLILGTPGGVGPFEAVLLTLLPHVEPESLLSAILAYRIVYYVIPALIGAVCVIRGPRKHRALPAYLNSETLEKNIDLSAVALNTLIENAPNAEAALLRHGRLSHFHREKSSMMVFPSNQSLIMLGGSLTKTYCPNQILADLQVSAKRRFLTPCLYKSSARLAAAARQSGWAVLPIAKEALINPQTYTTDGRLFRQLRRKLRKAENSEITITNNLNNCALPIEAMEKISADWVNMRGGERGFSMGVFDPNLIRHARVFLAWNNAELLGFLTLHHNPREQVLDLMRYREDAPEGMMHLLLDHAIGAARQQGLTKVSLASVPIGKNLGEPKLLAYTRTYLDQKTGANGLRQFKSCFAPNWQTQYIGAPTPIALGVSALDLIREITKE